MNKNYRNAHLKETKNTGQWYVAQYKRNSYLLAVKNLENQGLKTFLPIMETTKRKPMNFITELAPLFPGYIFVFFDLKAFNWLSINNTIGVSKLLTNNNIPRSIPHNFITSLKKRCDENNKLIIGNEFKIGSDVEVVKGPFAKMVGSIESIDAKKRIGLLFEILGRETRISFPSDSLSYI